MFQRAILIILVSISLPILCDITGKNVVSLSIYRQEPQFFRSRHLWGSFNQQFWKETWEPVQAKSTSSFCNILFCVFFFKKIIAHYCYILNVHFRNFKNIKKRYKSFFILNWLCSLESVTATAILEPIRSTIMMFNFYFSLLMNDR